MLTEKEYQDIFENEILPKLGLDKKFAIKDSKGYINRVFDIAYKSFIVTYDNCKKGDD